jgi:Mg-chelatase subunit ChlD
MTHGSPHRGRPRHPWRGRVTVLAVVVVALAVTGVLLVRSDVLDTTASAGCEPTTVTLSADPAIATLVDEATADLGPWLAEGDCFAVDVVSQQSSTTAAEIARPEGVGMSAPLPDLWLPDSSVWLDLAGASEAGDGRLADTSASVAVSPVVLAMPRDVAEAAGWPERQPSWRALLAQPEGRRALAVTDIEVDAPGMLTVSALTGSSPARLLGLTRRLAVPLLGNRSAAQVAASGEVDAIPSSEQEVIAANRSAREADQVVAVYDARVASSLDFPLTAVAADGGETSDVVRRAASVVEAALLDPATQDLLAAAGLRTAGGGDLAAMYGERQGVLPEEHVGDRGPSVRAVRTLSRAWDSVGRRSRMLVLVDRSGSMAERLPGSRRTRAELAQSSLREAIQQIAPDSDVGLWSFTTGLRQGDWDVLVPTGPLDAGSTTGATRREELLGAVGGLDPEPGGGTPLYDAVLAGYRDAQRDFSYGRLNAVIVVTDGRNQDPRSISLAHLLDALRLQFDGVRPVRIIAIGYGAQADTRTLRRITDITGGRTYRTLTASQVDNAFAEVLSNL